MRRSNRTAPDNSASDRQTTAKQLAGLLSHVHGKLLPVALPRLPLELGVHSSGDGVGAEWSAEEQDVGLGSVHSVVLPAPALLHADASPLLLTQAPVLRDRLGQVLRQHHVPASSDICTGGVSSPAKAAARNLIFERDSPVLVALVHVLLGVLDAGRHCAVMREKRAAGNLSCEGKRSEKGYRPSRYKQPRHFEISTREQAGNNGEKGSYAANLFDECSTKMYSVPALQCAVLFDCLFVSGGVYHPSQESTPSNSPSKYSSKVARRNL